MSVQPAAVDLGSARQSRERDSVGQTARTSSSSAGHAGQSADCQQGHGQHIPAGDESKDLSFPPEIKGEGQLQDHSHCSTGCPRTDMPSAKKHTEEPRALASSRCAHFVHIPPNLRQPHSWATRHPPQFQWTNTRRVSQGSLPRKKKVSLLHS